ncbi:MAG: hypothetical protein JWR85_2814 [Marmoricola sp.]|nr:hypothetical protein [Marmoricola sp.]
MDDLQRQPTDLDREGVAARIRRAHDEGRIGLTDRDIRLGNVQSAQSMAELDLLSRELDQLEAVLPAVPTDSPSATSAKPWFTFEPGKGGGDDDAGDGTPRSHAALISMVIAVALLAAAVAVFVKYGGSGSAAPPVSPGANPPAVSEAPASPAAKPANDPAPAPAGTKYSQTGPGIRWFLQTYQKRFGTTLVVDLTLYRDYVIVNAPVPGKARQSGWLFRDSKWTAFGGVRAVFPGAQTVDTSQLAIPPLMRNIARARATLNVEAPNQSYVIVRSIRNVDDVPSVDIHVTNEFRESGYLATTLAGRVERAYPYSS